MKKITCVVLVAVAVLCFGPLLAQARGPHGHWGGHGHGWGGYPGHWSLGFYWGFPGWYYPWGPYPYYSAPPAYVQPQQPPVYVQPQQPQEPAYWYFCQDPQGYYPYVKSCPGGWMKVVPNPTPPNP